MVRPLWLFLACVSIVVPTVWAQTPVDAVLVRDAKGDTASMGVPVPAGADAYDLIEIVLGWENATAAELHLRVAGVSSEPAAGEIGAHVKINGSFWIVGWTTIAFPVPPFVHRGGFYCPSDAARAVDASKCDGLSARIERDAYVLILDRATLGASAAGLVLEQARGYSDVYNSDGTAIRLDETAPGLPYRFGTGAAANATAPKAREDPPIDATQSSETLTQDVGTRSAAESPGLPMVALLAVLASLTRMRRRA